jgi:hypothetical protein
MKTDFSNSLDGLMRINGRSSNDMQAADAAVDELVQFVEVQYNTINAFTELHEAVTCPDEEKIRSSLASMRHVTAGLATLSDFHKNGLLSTTFETAYHRANELLKKAEKESSAVLAHIPR